MSDKKYTHKEAAMAVLAKVAEIAKKHETVLEKSNGQQINANSVAGAQGESSPPMNPMKMNEESNAPLTPQGQTVGDAQAPKGTKGHIKLAKFIGRMEHKRGGKSNELDKGETGYERGVHTKGNSSAGNPGTSHAGDKIAETSYLSPRGSKAAVGEAKEQHKQVLGDMKQIKPKLPS